MNSISFSNRICSWVCASLVAAILAVQISPLAGIVSLLVLTVGLLRWKQIKSALHRFDKFCVSTHERGQKWSGHENWPEVLLAFLMLPAGGLAGWIIYLSFMDWATKDTIVAGLVILLSIALPACAFRKEKAIDETVNTDDEPKQRKTDFELFTWRLLVSGFISFGGIMFVTCPAFH